MLGEARYAQGSPARIRSKPDVDACVEQGLHVLHVGCERLLFAGQGLGVGENPGPPRCATQLRGEGWLQAAAKEWLLQPPWVLGIDVERLVEAERRDVPSAATL